MPKTTFQAPPKYIYINHSIKFFPFLGSRRPLQLHSMHAPYYNKFLLPFKPLFHSQKKHQNNFIVRNKHPQEKEILDKHHRNRSNPNIRTSDRARGIRWIHFIWSANYRARKNYYYFKRLPELQLSFIKFFYSL